MVIISRREGRTLPSRYVAFALGLLYNVLLACLVGLLGF